MHKHNFTLIEILVSITIIAILAGILIGGLNYASKRADTAKTQAILEEFQMALDAFKHDNGYYPPCLNGEQSVVGFRLDTSVTPNVFQLALIDNHANYKYYNFEKTQTRNPYFEIQVPNSGATITLDDAWGNAIHYQCGTGGARPLRNPQGYDLWSDGPTSSTDDDLTNWKQN